MSVLMSIVAVFFFLFFFSLLQQATTALKRIADELEYMNGEDDDVGDEGGSCAAMSGTLTNPHDAGTCVMPRGHKGDHIGQGLAWANPDPPVNPPVDPPPL